MIVDFNELKRRFRFINKPTEKDIDDLIDSLVIYNGMIDGHLIIPNTLPITKIRDASGYLFASDGTGVGTSVWTNPVVHGDLSGTLPAPSIKSSVVTNSDRPISSSHIRDGSIPPGKLSAVVGDDSKVLGNVSNVMDWRSLETLQSTSGIEILAQPLTIIDCLAQYASLDTSARPQVWVPSPPTLVSFPSTNAGVCKIGDLVVGNHIIGTHPLSDELIGRVPVAAIVSINGVAMTTLASSKERHDIVVNAYGSSARIKVLSIFMANNDHCGFGCHAVIPTNQDGQFEYLNDPAVNTKTWIGSIKMQLIGYIYRLA